MNNEEDKYRLHSKIEYFLASLSKFYEEEGQKLLQKIIVNSEPRVEFEWSSDDWDRSTSGHSVYLAMPESIYLSIVEDKMELQSEIKEGLNKINDIQMSRPEKG